MPVEPAPESPRTAAAAMPIDNPAGRVRKRQRAAAAGEMPIAATPPDVDPAAIRAGLGLTQAAFATAFGLSVGTVRDWEQSRCQPDGPASVLLRVIERRPDAVREALGAMGSP